MNTEKFEYYRNKIFKYIQETIVPKYHEIESCSMEIYPEHVEWDVGFIFKQNKEKYGFKNYKSTNILEQEIRYLLHGYCTHIGAGEYYLFILPIFV